MKNNCFLHFYHFLMGKIGNEIKDKSHHCSDRLIFSALAAHDLVKEMNATTKEQQLQVLSWGLL